MIEVTCDGCGRKQTVKRFDKPREWFSREDDDGVQLACSRQCIRKTAEATGKSGLVMPLTALSSELEAARKVVATQTFKGKRYRCMVCNGTWEPEAEPQHFKLCPVDEYLRVMEEQR